MGKNPTEAKAAAAKREQSGKLPKNVLHIEYYTKKDGNLGLKKFFKKEIL